MKSIIFIYLIFSTQFFCFSETSINFESSKSLNFEGENYLDLKIEEFTKLKLHRIFNVMSFSNQYTFVVSGCFGIPEEKRTKLREPLNIPDFKLSVRVPNN